MNPTVLRSYTLPSTVLLLLLSLIFAAAPSMAISHAIQNRFVVQLLLQNVPGMVELLHEDPSQLIDPSVRDNKALRMALTGNHIELVRQLLRYDTVQPNWAGGSLLVEPVEEGSTEVVRLLLDDGRVDPTAFEYRCVTLAVENNRVEILRMLLDDPRVHVPATDVGYWINVSASLGHLEILKALVGLPNVRLDDHVETICVQASHSDHWAILRWILADSRVDKNQLVYALGRAVEHGVQDIVRIYLSDPHFQLTALMYNDIQFALQPWLVEQLVDYFTADYRKRDPCIGERFTEFARKDGALKALLSERAIQADDQNFDEWNVKYRGPIDHRIQRLWLKFEEKAVLIQRACRHWAARFGGPLYRRLADKYRNIMLSQSHSLI